MEHCGLTTVEQLNRAAKSNITISFFIDHLRFYAESYKTKIFGERVNRWTPLSEATKADIKWTIHQVRQAKERFLCYPNCGRIILIAIIPLT